MIWAPRELLAFDGVAIFKYSAMYREGETHCDVTTREQTY
jgi:hypothetical protein